MKNKRAFIESENGSLLNVDRMERVEPRHNAKTATAWASGVILAADSHLVYQYFFADNKEEVIRPTRLRKDVDGIWVKAE